MNKSGIRAIYYNKISKYETQRHFTTKYISGRSVVHCTKILQRKVDRNEKGMPNQGQGQVSILNYAHANAIPQQLCLEIVDEYG
jgi:hypothetical protein